MTPPNTFTGAALDRAGDRRRDDAWVAAQRADPARARRRGRPRRRARRGRPARARPARAGRRRAAAARPRRARSRVRRRAGGAGRPAARACARPPPPSPGPTAGWPPTRRRCSPGTAATAICANCGRVTEVREGGHVRHCPSCGAEHHPRTDPVVIMLVLRGDEVLLGRQPSWPPGRYSALAGFVEPGESLEEAVAREVREEAGSRSGRRATSPPSRGRSRPR